MWWMRGLLVVGLCSVLSLQTEPNICAAAEEKKEEKKEEEEEEEDEVGGAFWHCCLDCGTACVPGLMSSWRCVWHEPVPSIGHGLCEHQPACCLWRVS